MKKGINNEGFKALPSSVQTNILSNMRYGGNTFAAGGAMPMEQLTEFNEGGRHEENGLGGIPQGMNPEGQMNLVEEGETKFDAENYIYSDSLKIDKELAEAFNLSPKMVGKTFADASKVAGRKKSKREGDAIEEAANNADLENLMQAQEAFKQARIEEKLQEIAELDPNALPALMGQGQPQGDPAMGGQIQEAPMDEQAMMEQQMMAEQQAGGGQPAPEEMAMMQQQQDMAMGQQEGMMRNGGHTRSYNLGSFMGMNMANAGMMNTGAIGTTEDPKGCPCANGSVSTACCSRDYEKFDEGVYKEKFDESGDKIAIADRNAGFRGSSRKLPFRYRLALKNADVNYSQQVSGTDGGTRGSLLKDSNMSQNYANIDMSQYTPEQQELMQGKLWATSPRTWAELNPDVLNKKDLNQMTKVANALNWTPKAKNTKYIPTDFDRDRNPGLSDRGIIRNDKRVDAGKLPKTIDFDRDIFGWMKTHLNPNLEPMQYKPKVVRQSGPFAGSSRWIWNEDKGVKIKSNEFGGNLMQSGQEVGINPMQGMNQLMRKGGKMCYGCGGAMHNYGGAMNNMPGKKFEFGAGLDIASNVLDKASTFLPPVLKEVVSIGSKVTGTMADKQQGKPVTAGDYIGDVIGGATSSFPGAEKLVDTITDVATSKNKARQEEILNDARNNPNDPLHKQTIDRDKAMAESKQLQNANKFNKILDSTLGVATQFINPGEDSQDIMDTIPENVDDVPDLNFARYGKKLYGKGGGLWANIQAKKERMGSNYRPAQPGDPNRPTAAAIKAAQNDMGGRLYEPGGYMSTMFAGPEINDLDLKTTNDDGTYGGDMDSAFIDMSLNANPADLISPAYNLGMGLFGKSADTSYDVEKFTYKPFDFTQTKNALRRQTAKAINQLGRKGTGNPANLLALSQIGSKLEADYLQKAQNVNIQREQAAMDKNTKAKNAYEKEQRELKLKEQAIRDELIKAGLADIQSISDKNAQTEYMFKFMQSMAPDVVKGSYKNMSKMFMDIFKKTQKNKNKKTD